MKPPIKKINDSFEKIKGKTSVSYKNKRYANGSLSCSLAQFKSLWINKK